MGSDKALLAGHGGPLLAVGIRRLSQVCDLVIVVAGKNAEALRPVVYENAGFMAINPAPERGQFSSLRLGLQAVLEHGRDAAFVSLVDRPAPDLQTLNHLRETFLRSHPAQTWAVVPEYQGKHGHPFVAGREMIEAFLRAPENTTARAVEHSHQEKILYVPVADSNVTMDLNTPEEYQSWKLEQERQ